MRWIAMLAFGALLCPAVARATESCGDPPSLGDGWILGSPEQEGLDRAIVCAIGPRLKDLTEANPHGVVVVRHGALVYEDYFSGEDQRWPQQHWRERLVQTPRDARTKHDMQSITKSVVALLFGIALDHGSVKNIDAPVLTLLPEYADLRTTEKERMTVRDFLMMTAGLQWPYKPYLSMARQVDAAPDPYRLILEQPLVAPPGKLWHYNNGSVEIVGAVLKKATGRPLDQFAKDVLFDPLGIDDWEWGRMANGDPGASWGLRLRPRDLAKIGQLVLNSGTWQGQRIVSSAWIDDMTAPHVTRRQGSYGYLWWLSRRSINDRDFDVIIADGWGGQSLYVVPRLDLLIVVTAGVYDFDGQGSQGVTSDAVVDLVFRAAIAR
jgi:CubicO group peptidase (beta-lactamase class C family)